MENMSHELSEPRDEAKPTPDKPGQAPLLGVYETALYLDDLAAAERFYGGVLGLEKIFSAPGRQLVYRCQENFVLLFNAQQTTVERIVINGGAIPFHGAKGPGHMAFRVTADTLETWRRRFREAGVNIESEVIWPNGAQSLYFRDPAGNSLELATPDLWRDFRN